MVLAQQVEVRGGHRAPVPKEPREGRADRWSLPGSHRPLRAITAFQQTRSAVTLRLPWPSLHDPLDLVREGSRLGSCIMLNHQLTSQAGSMPCRTAPQRTPVKASWMLCHSDRWAALRGPSCLGDALIHHPKGFALPGLLLSGSCQPSLSPLQAPQSPNRRLLPRKGACYQRRPRGPGSCSSRLMQVRGRADTPQKTAWVAETPETVLGVAWLAAGGEERGDGQGC